MQNGINFKNKVLLLLWISLGLTACNQTSSKEDQKKTDSVSETKIVKNQNTAEPRSLFTKSDAEKILGEPAHLSDSSLGNPISQLAYTANQKDKKGKTGVVYFLYEHYAFDSTAHRIYTSIMKANEHNGIKILTDMGDEAYFHSDNTNFYFVMARKANKMFRIKVNKITATTSLDEFNRISKNIVEAL